MNFILSSTTLLRHLQSISGVLSTSNSMPILDNFLFEINESNLINNFIVTHIDKYNNNSLLELLIEITTYFTKNISYNFNLNKL